MHGGPAYDTAKGQPRMLNGPDFFGQKTEISIAPSSEPQNSGTESVTVNSSTTENFQALGKINRNKYPSLFGRF